MLNLTLLSEKYFFDILPILQYYILNLKNCITIKDVIELKKSKDPNHLKTSVSKKEILV